jgi:hypothetical protein
MGLYHRIGREEHALLFAVEAPERVIATGKGVYNVKRSGE